MFASGKPTSLVMFVGEAPGHEETVHRAPLVGAAGQLFEKMILGPAGLDRREVYITNAVLCRPNGRNRNPFIGEVEACLEHLDAQVLLVSPKLIVSLGNTPMFATCDDEGITKKRGVLRWSRAWSDGRKVPVLPMFHPAYCLRGSGLEEMRQDVQMLARLLADVAVGKELMV